jgi:LPXTG-motif cell wall-anchored protein
MRPQPVGGHLPVTGGSSALLALSGLGLAGAGLVLYRLGRTRRGEHG